MSVIPFVLKNKSDAIDLEAVKNMITYDHIHDWANSFFDMLEWEGEDLKIHGPQCDKFINEIMKFTKAYIHGT